MKNNNRTNEKFLDEIGKLNEKIAKLEKYKTGHKQAEKSLVQAAGDWQKTFDATNDVIWILDKEHRVLQSNKAAEKIFQQPCEELIGKHCYEIVHGTKEPIPECPFLLTKKSLKRETMELNLGKLWFQVTVDPILDAENQYTAVVHIISDITERKQAEKELRESEERLRAIFDSAGDGIVETDISGKIVKVNKAVLRSFGSDSEEDFIGKSSIDFIASFDKTRAFQAYEKTNFDSQVVDYEFVALKIDGTPFPVQILSSVLRNVDGNQIGFVGAIRDITERKKAEKEVEKQRLYFKALFNSSPDAIVSVDMDHNVVDVNPEFNNLFGFSTDEVLGKNLNEIIVPKDKLEEAETITKKILNGQILKKESKRFRKDRSLIDVLINAAPVIIDGKQAGGLGIYEDITERKQVEEELRRRNKELQTFNDVVVSRELKMIELKKEINELLEKSGEEPKYQLPV